MKTGLKKYQKTTEIFFDEASPIITIATYNTDLKNRLSAYSEKHPDLCKLVDDSEDGRLMFEIEKGRFCFRLTEPYSKERRSAASEFAKKQKHTLRKCNSKNKWHLSQRAMDLSRQIRLPRLFDAVSSVLASTEFVATKRLVSTFCSA